MQRLALTAFLLGSTWLVAPAAYAEQTVPAHHVRHARSAIVQVVVGNYLNVKEIAELPAPPRSKSRAAKADIKQIIGAQAFAAPEEIAAAKDEQNLRPELIVKVLGKDLSRTNLPLTYALLDRVGTDVNTISGAAKKHWHTTRPYRLDHRVKLMIDPLPVDNYGYPSGHTSTSLVWAQIMAQLEPDAAARLQHQADRIAWHRVLAGVHTPHDLEGGKKIGAAIFAALVEKPTFQADLAAARAEFVAYRTASVPPVRKNWKSFKSRITE